MPRKRVSLGLVLALITFISFQKPAYAHIRWFLEKGEHPGEHFSMDLTSLLEPSFRVSHRSGRTHDCTDACFWHRDQICYSRVEHIFTRHMGLRWTSRAGRPLATVWTRSLADTSRIGIVQPCFPNGQEYRGIVYSSW